MTMFSQLRHQVAIDLKIFRRNPAATFFTVILPLIFLFIFVGLYGNQELDNGARVANFYVAGILALSIVSATMVNVAMGMTARRERGILKRVRGTPLRPIVFIAAQAVASIVIAAVMSVVLITIGWVVFDVSLSPSAAGPLIGSVIIGAMSFSVLGLALTILIPSEEAAPAVTNAIVLPLYFISDVFIADFDKPPALEAVAKFFPVQHLSSALYKAFDPTATGTNWPLGDWLIILVWGLVGVGATSTWFRWTPRR